MALLVRKLSFLPFVSARTSGNSVAAYISSRTFATRKSANKTPTVVINDNSDDTTTDEDEEVREDFEVVQVDNTVRDTDVRDVDAVMCRVFFPVNRRAWATSQDENAICFRMDMPGVAKEDVKVYVDDMKLVVRGRYAQQKENFEDESQVLADNVGVYSAELYLPDNVQTDKIRSQMKDGVLLVTAPKQVTNVLVE